MFSKWRPFDILNLLWACLDNPRRVLLVFINVQNFVGIYAEVSIICKCWYLTSLAWKFLCTPPKWRVWGLCRVNGSSLIAIPKGHLLAYKCHATYISLRSVQFFYTATLLSHTQNPMLCNGSSTPLKVPLSVGASAPPSNTWYPGFTRLGIANGTRNSHFRTAEALRFLYFTMCCPFLPQNYPLHIGESELLFNTWFLGPTWVDFPNNMTTGSAVFAGLTIVTDKRLKAPLFVNFGSSINQSINWLNKRTDRPLTLTCMNTCRKTFHNTHEYKIQRLGMGEWAASHVAHSLIFTYMECYDGYPELYLAVCAVHFCLYAFRHNTFT